MNIGGPEERIANTDDDRDRKLVRPWLAHVWIQKVAEYQHQHIITLLYTGQYGVPGV